ncbi:hypothetical protein [Leptodesmis sp.]|uniref:hypothetical protein n=1 Tax=Leptodesmis sp. TaxID=3100501 RepID=UPI0040534FBD
MKSDLKRIEAALQQVSYQTMQPETLPSRSLQPSLPFMDWDQQFPRLEAAGMPRSATVEPSPGLHISSPVALEGIEVDVTAVSLSNPAAIARTPNLPEFVAAVPESSRQQAMAAPALATNLLGDLQNRVQEWTLGLQEILEQIQALYSEGPVIEGWLESSGATYRLCGVNEEGQLWYRPCPPEQILDISLAIVRYQKLQQLFSRKRSLEIRLTYLTETLLSTHSRLAELS